MKPRWILALEGLALLLAAGAAFRGGGLGWGFAAAAFAAPDLGILGYLGGRRLGAWIYNGTHTTVLPLAWALWQCRSGPIHSLALPALWLAHIGLDRLLGFGLKYPDGFHPTHLQKV